MTDVKWKIEKDLCRCCHSEGSFRNLDAPFANDFGEEEIYGKMLREQLGIALFKIEGIMSEVTYTICEGCIFRLREATDFKRQVLSCEEKFHDMFNRNMFTVSIPTLTTVKKEVQDEIDLNYVAADDDGDMGADDDDNYSLEDLKFSEDDDKPLGLSSIKKETPQKKRKTTVKPANKVTKKTTTRKAAKSKTKAETTESIPATSAEKKQVSVPTLTTVKKEVQDEIDLNYGTTRFPDDLIGEYTVLETEFTRQCKRCEKKIKTHKQFRAHFDRVHQCRKCKQRYDTYDDRVKHMKKCHEEPSDGAQQNDEEKGPYRCNVCSKMFELRHQLSNHLRRIHPPGGIRCEPCDLTFPRHVDLINHRYDEHLKKPKHKCKMCNYETRKQSCLKAHTDRVHLKVLAVTCQVCGLQFYCETNLRSHMVKHTKVRNFECDICKKAFATKKTIISHLRSHLGIKTMVCRVCGKAFVQRISLKNHLKKYHPDTVKLKTEVLKTEVDSN
ncbi:myoneurin isoform X2 [Plutella xylostella]|uniref:myoneurin isoform X2 n=1 Tax=Plutella xylostella TaxID=51655 RepID=UPI002032D10A|nr:myoneurin isoform X2 [Plutella xylostella]